MIINMENQSFSSRSYLLHYFLMVIRVGIVMPESSISVRSVFYCFNSSQVVIIL